MAGETDRRTPFVDPYDKILQGLNLSTKVVDRESLKEIARERSGRTKTRQARVMALNTRISIPTYDMLEALVTRLGVEGRREIVEIAVRALMGAVLRIEKADREAYTLPPIGFVPELYPEETKKWKLPT